MGLPADLVPAYAVNEIAAGRIATVEPDLKAEAIETIDARGKIVLFVGKLDARNAQERMQGIKEELNGSNVTILDTRTDDTERVLEAFDARMKFVLPLSWPAAAENPQGRYGVGIQLFGRLKPGVTLEQARADSSAVARRISQDNRLDEKQMTDVMLLPLKLMAPTVALPPVTITSPDVTGASKVKTAL